MSKEKDLKEIVWKHIQEAGSGMITEKDLWENLKENDIECTYEEVLNVTAEFYEKKKIFYGTGLVIWIRSTEEVMTDESNL